MFALLFIVRLVVTIAVGAIAGIGFDRVTSRLGIGS